MAVKQYFSKEGKLVIELTSGYRDKLIFTQYESMDMWGEFWLEPFGLDPVALEIDSDDLLDQALDILHNNMGYFDPQERQVVATALEDLSKRMKAIKKMRAAFTVSTEENPKDRTVTYTFTSRGTVSIGFLLNLQVTQSAEFEEERAWMVLADAFNPHHQRDVEPLMIKEG